MRPLLRNISKNPEMVFVLLALLMGGMFLVAIPPFQTPDEATHVLRAYEVSNFKTPQRNGDGRAGSGLPKSIHATQEAVHGVFTPGRLGAEGYHPKQVKNALSIPLNADDKMFYSTSGSPTYFPGAYVLHALVVWLLNLFDSPVILTLYFLRLINLLLWVVLGYFSIKLFPFKKWAVVGVALLPMMVAQSISVGLDVIFIGLSLLYLSIVLRAYSVENYIITKKRFCLLLLLAIIMVLSKSVAAVLLPIIFIVKKNKFKLKFPNFAKACIIIIPIVVYLLWGIISKSSSEVSMIGTDAVGDPSAQVSALIGNPLDFVMDLVRTMLVHTVHGSIVVNSIIGNFGPLDTPLPLISVVFGYMLLMFIFLYNYKESTKTLIAKSKTRLILALCIAAYVGSVFASMYVFYSLPDHDIIRGVNGRYFIPVLFLMIPLLYNSISMIKKRAYVSIVLFGVAWLFVSSLIVLFYRYYDGL